MDGRYHQPLQVGLLRLHSGGLAWLILAISIVLTVVAYLVSAHYVEVRARERLEFRASEVAEAIQGRMQVYEQVLWSVAGLVDSVPSVDRGQFSRFIDSLDLPKRWPGIQGVGYSIPVRAEDKAAHEQLIRSQGFPDYSIKPAGDRDLYTAIIYIEPFDWRNQRAFGYDMYSNDIRRQAMVHSRDNGVAASSGIITLVQETKEQVQKGFLVYVPLYREGVAVNTVEDRRRQFIGWVYAAFRARDLMEGILGSADENMVFQVYDGDLEEPERLLFASSPKRLDRAGLVVSKRIALHGRHWTVVFGTPAELIDGDDSDLPAYVAIAGLVVDLLLFYVIASLHFINRRTERLVADKTLELSRSRQDERDARNFLDSVIENLPVMLFVKDANDLHFRMFNKAGERITGISRSELLGKSDFDFFTREIAQEHVEADRQVLASGRVLDIPEERINTAQGDRWLHTVKVPVAGADGRPAYLLGMSEDITEKRELEQRFKALFDAAPSGLLLADAQGRIVVCNPLCSRIFGYEQAELLTMGVADLVPEALRDIHEGHVRDYGLQQGRGSNAMVDINGRCKDGSLVPLDIGLQPILHDGQRFVLASIMDVSERRVLIDDLRKANRYKTEFLANMSHELRTPLNAIIGFTERVLKRIGETLPDRERDALHTVQRNSYHLLGLISDILDLSKIEAGKMEVAISRFCLTDLLADTVVQNRLDAGKKGLSFRLELPHEELFIISDPLRVLQIYNNLVSNAIKYTDSGGVVVSVALAQDPHLGDCARIDVVDTGIGIQDRDKAKIFREFARLDEVRQRNIQGTGLGLLISSQLAGVLGGRISFASEHGKGSHFTVLLPLKR